MIRWRVGTKIISIGVIVLVAFVAITAFYTVVNRKVDVLNAADEEATFHVEKTSITRDAFLKARIAERSFNENPDEATARTARDHTALARQTLAAMAAKTVQPDEKTEVATAIAALEAYGRQFDSLQTLWEKLGYDENKGLQGSLRKSVHGIETGLKDAGADPALLSQMLTLRRHEKDFILRRSRSYLERFDKTVDEFRSALTAAGQQNLLPMLDSYQKDFTALVEGTLTVNAANAALEKAAAGFLPLIDALFRRNLDEMNAAKTAAAEMRAFATMSSTIGLLAVAIFSLLVAYAVGRSIGRPLAYMTDVMTALAGGDLSKEVPEMKRSDEVADMARALRVFKTNAVEKARLDTAERTRLETEQRAAAEARERDARISRQIAEFCAAVGGGRLDERIATDGLQGVFRDLAGQMNGLAATLQGMAGELAKVMGAMVEGDLTHRVTGNYEGVFGDLKSSSNRMGETLRDFAQRLSQNAEAVKAASAEISSGSQDLAQRTESQAASIEETAASMHEITTTVKHNADNAQAANQLAGTARQTAEKGGAVTADAVAAVRRIEESAQKIADIVGLIDEIAFQTNLLALNASVEAARAGEAGKGFAVVAQEVRALAQRSANASKDIKALITESSGQVKTGASLVDQTGAALEDIVEAIKKVSDIVAEIAAASREQATGLDQINTAVGSMDEMTQRNGALVEETSASAQALANQAADLARLVSFFRS
ncbi:methyl-accepting chemotaxis protein [Ferrovibrio sp.]|uniref:methyl-accepting chemotaxis protein n=1 Tax=Ferrovibrio sp. TaxID=1917215 RepID=UPI00311E23AB